MTPRVALVVSEYHTFVTHGLEAGARAVLQEAGWSDDRIDRLAVPGAYELAQAARRVAGSGTVDAVVCLGCLIRGETPHFDYIAQAAAHGIMHAAQATGVPVTFGLLTTNTVEEAIARSSSGPMNKGREAAAAALAMIDLYRAIAGPNGPGPS
ncbi:MAG: 6,7-dimethyl-8-ribityllumazine synthase [Acidobacteria bacterium]|nr:6,7-dimethyl-8-ribityllumazine synthase [Acidobacteriota bacterium]